MKHADTTMKKSPFPARLAVVAVCALALVGAGVAVAAVGARTAEPEVEAPSVPTTMQATVKADGVLISGPTMQRGDTLTNVVDATELTGAYAGVYYRAVYNGQTVYVVKGAVRTSEEAVPEQWTGYAAADAIIYAKPDFSGDDILTLQLNEEVTVLDSFADKLFVRNADGFEGYMPADKVSREKNPEPQQAAPAASSNSSSKKPSSGSSSSSKKPSSSSSSGNSNSGSSNSSGGGTGGGGNNAGTNTGGGGSVDGGEINIGDLGAASASRSGSSAALSLLGVERAYADEPAEGEQSASADAAEGDAASEEGVTATVLIDGTQTYLTLLNRGDVVTVKVDEQFGFTDRTLQEGATLPVFATEQDAGAEDDAADGEKASSQDAAADEEMTQALSDEERDLAAAEAPTEDVCTVLINDQEATLPENLLTLEIEAAYAAWDGFAAEDATLYSNYQLTAGATPLEVNAPIKVIDFIGSTLVVQVESGIFYLAQAHASKEQVEVVEEEVQEQPATSSSSSSSKGSSSGGSSKKPSSSSGSSGSSGNSGSSTSSGSSGGNTGGGSNNTSTGGDGSSDGNEWTAPTL